MDTDVHAALRAAMCHETAPLIDRLEAENRRLKLEVVRLHAGLGNRYLRSVLNLVDKHRSLGYDGVDVLDNNLVLADEDEAEDQMLEELIHMDVRDKLAVIPYLTTMGYFVIEIRTEGNWIHDCPFSVNWDTTEDKLRKVYAASFERGSILYQPVD